MSRVFYRADSGFTGDVIPFYDNGKFYLYYLHSYRNAELHGGGVPWYCVTTTDFVHYEEHGEVIPRAAKADQDYCIFTGCIFKESDRKYHLFFTGHNPYKQDTGRPVQAVMHAVSEDLLYWEKEPEDTFYAPSDLYEEDDWRDPFIFRNEETGDYWMLLAARAKEGPASRRGVTALCVSSDLKHWEVKDEPFWAPRAHFAHECPDLFRMGDWWYLIYSEFTDRCVTRYRMAKELHGPWLAPRDDAFDGRAYYAAKSASDGGKRYLFGWNPTKLGSDDYAEWEWGGHLVAHEIFPQDDGALGARVPETVRGHFGEAVLRAGPIALNRVDGLANVRLAETSERVYRIHANVRFDNQATRLGIQLRYDEAKDESYIYALEPANDRFCFGELPIQQWKPANFLNVARPIRLESDRLYELDLYVEDEVCVAYLDNRLALSARMYRNPGAGIGLFVADGNAVFEEVTVYRPARSDEGTE